MVTEYNEFNSLQPDDINLCPICGQRIVYAPSRYAGDRGIWSNAVKVEGEEGWFYPKVDYRTVAHECPAPHTLTVLKITRTETSQKVKLSNGKSYPVSLAWYFEEGKSKVVITKKGAVACLHDLLGHPRLTMRRGRFSIDDGPIYAGYTTDRHWNGWAMPYFTREECERMGTDTTARCATEYLRYDPKADAYRYFDGCGKDTDDNVDVWPGEDIFADGGIVHVYGIGAGCWIWENENE